MRFRIRPASPARSEEVAPVGDEGAQPQPEPVPDGEHSAADLPTNDVVAAPPNTGMPGRTEAERRAETAALRNYRTAAGAAPGATPEESVAP